MSVVHLEHVSKQYPTPGEPLVVLKDISLVLEAGQNLAVVGPSGSGKSTLLNILGTLDRPTSGLVRIVGVDPSTLSSRELAAFRNKHIGFVFQEHYLLPQLTVLENVLIPALATDRSTTGHVSRAKELLERVGLSTRMHHRPSELSGGERQRVAVARALLLQPSLVLADEPTGSLDPTNARAVARLLLELQEQEKNVLVVVTHSWELASRLMQRKLLDDGQLRDDGMFGP